MKHKTADTVERVVHLVELTGYDQEHWVNCQAYGAADWQSLISLWAAYNRHRSHIFGRYLKRRYTMRANSRPAKA